MSENDKALAVQADAQVVEKPQEVVLIPETPQNIYQGASTQRFTKEEEEKLRRKLTDDEIEIRPHDGCLYLPEMKYRNRLNDIFGPGAWALIPVGGWANRDKTVAREYALYIRGRFIAQATGEMDIIGGNKNITWATACEGARSNALVRCCKDIGIASELWDKNFDDEWKVKHAKQGSNGWHKTGVVTAGAKGGGVGSQSTGSSDVQGEDNPKHHPPSVPPSEQERVEKAFGGEEVPPQDPSTEPTHQEPKPGGASVKQVGSIYSLLANKKGIKDRDEAHKWVSNHLAMTITTMNELTMKEAWSIIDGLLKSK